MIGFVKWLPEDPGTLGAVDKKDEKKDYTWWWILGAVAVGAVVLKSGGGYQSNPAVKNVKRVGGFSKSQLADMKKSGVGYPYSGEVDGVRKFTNAWNAEDARRNFGEGRYY